MPRFPGFIGPSYTLRSLNMDCQRCVNYYPEMDELMTGKEKEIAALVMTPGERLFGNYGTGLVRGTYTGSDGHLYVVVGNQLSYVKADGTAQNLGILLSSTGMVSMADNGIQLMIVDGASGYIFDSSATPQLQAISDVNFSGGRQVVFQDGYFLVVTPGTQILQWSNLNDGTTWDPLDNNAAMGSADKLVGLVSDHNQIWLFGEQTTEIYYDTGGANTDATNQTFQRIPGAFIEIGCASAFSIAKLNNSVLWLGAGAAGQGIVWKASQGYQPTRISNHAVELAMQSYGDLSGTVAWVYQQDGHHFYCLNFANAKTTWVYDDAVGVWHERTYTDPLLGQIRHNVVCHAFAYNLHIVGDAIGNLYVLDENVFTDNGATITRMRTSPHLSQDMIRFKHEAFQLDMETGTGLDGGVQGSNPKVMMQFSDDYGYTWSHEVWVTAGAMGNFHTRAIWQRLGVARDRVYRVKITDPVRCNLVGAQLRLVPGRS